MSNIIKYKMKLEVLTPLHIGGADYKSKLDKKEYVFDKDKGTLTLIDSEKFISFLIKKNLFDDYIFYIQKNLNLKKYEQDKNIKLIDFLKSRDIYKNIEEFRKKAPIKIDAEIEEMNDIKLMLRNLQGKPYIPGSSIKGAIINFLLVNYIINHRDKFKIERNKILEIAKKANNDNDIKKAKNDKNFVINKIPLRHTYKDGIYMLTTTEDVNINVNVKNAVKIKGITAYWDEENLIILSTEEFNFILDKTNTLAASKIP